MLMLAYPGADTGLQAGQVLDLRHFSAGKRPMSQFQSSKMSQERFLRISVNLLFKSFVEASRTEAKKLFREIEDGTRDARPDPFDRHGTGTGDAPRFRRAANGPPARQEKTRWRG